MNDGRAQRERGLFDDLRSGMGAALESMLGHAPAMSVDPLPAAPDNATLRWRQPLGSLPGVVWILAAEADWKSVGRAVLRAAGVEDSDDAGLKSTYFEVINQGLAGFAQALTIRLDREVSPNGGALAERQAGDPPAAARWAELDVTAGDLAFAVIVGMEDALLDEIESVLRPAELAAAAPEASALAAVAESPAGLQSIAGNSKTFDLLLEVELPVSVSFGRAQIPLKDVLKLATGSIVELNRAIAEPVEVIVNNCVIARGEVVVVEGNFGVRIQEVISRQERLRTLQ